MPYLGSQSQIIVEDSQEDAITGYTQKSLGYRLGETQMNFE